MEMFVRVRKTHADAVRACGIALERGAQWAACMAEWDISLAGYCEEATDRDACLEAGQITMVKPVTALEPTPVYADVQAIYNPFGETVACDEDVMPYCDAVCGPQSLTSEKWIGCSQLCWHTFTAKPVWRTETAAPDGLLVLAAADKLCWYACNDEASGPDPVCYARCLAKGPTAQDECAITGVCVEGTVDPWAGYNEADDPCMNGGACWELDPSGDVVWAPTPAKDHGADERDMVPF